MKTQSSNFVPTYYLDIIRQLNGHHINAYNSTTSSHIQTLQDDLEEITLDDSTINQSALLNTDNKAPIPKVDNFVDDLSENEDDFNLSELLFDTTDGNREVASHSHNKTASVQRGSSFEGNIFLFEILKGVQIIKHYLELTYCNTFATLYH